MAQRPLIQAEPRPFLLQVYSLKGLPQPREWGLQVKTAALAGLALGILTLVALLYLTQASQVATTTYDIRQMGRRLAVLERDNALLSYQISQLARPEYILERALGIGLTTTLTLEYLSPEDIEGESYHLSTTPRAESEPISQTSHGSGEAQLNDGQGTQAGWRGWYARLARWARGHFHSPAEVVAKGAE